MYIENIYQVSREIFYSVKTYSDIENIIDVAVFKERVEKINMIKIHPNLSEIYYFKKENGSNKLKRCIKSKQEGKINIPFWSLDLCNSNTSMPIEKRFVDNKTISSFYYFDLESKKEYFSFDKDKDFVFQTVSYEVGNTSIYEKDYLIPLLKTKRSKLYKPSFVKTRDNELVDYKYLIDGKDCTELARLLLLKLKIDNPEKHDFTVAEKVFFITNIKKELQFDI